MTNIHIPPEAVEAAARAIKQWLDYTLDKDTRASELTDGEHDDLATAAIRAALAAWPGMNHDSQAWRGYGGEVLILPLPQEPRDEPV